MGIERPSPYGAREAVREDRDDGIADGKNFDGYAAAEDALDFRRCC